MQARLFILAMDSYTIYLLLTEVRKLASKQVADCICVSFYKMESRFFILAMVLLLLLLLLLALVLVLVLLLLRQ